MGILKFKDVKSGVSTIAIGIFLLITLVLVMFFVQKKQIQESSLLEVSSDLKTYTNEIDSKIANVVTDLLLIEELFLFQSDIDFTEGKITFKVEDNRENVQEGLISWLENKNIYDQIRILDLNGDEVIRVNYNNGEPSFVGLDELQNKANRYYFSNAIGLSDNSIYLSEIDLNVENGEIEYINSKPKEMLRVASPLFLNDEKIGLIIINYLSSNLFTPDENLSDYSFEVLNDDGYYLYSENEEMEYGFMFEEKSNEMFSSYHEYDIYSNSDTQIIQDVFNGDLYTTLIISESVLTDTISKNIQKNISIVSENSSIVVFEVFNLKNVPEYKNLVILMFVISFIGVIISYIVSLLVSEVTYQRKNQLLSLEYSATHDVLTGLYNRNKMYQLLNYYTSRKLPFSVLFMDLDGFKLVNDNLGHDAGDDILIETSKRLKEAVREVDIVSRLGGDEFLILLQSVNNKIDIEKIVSHLKTHISRDFYYKKNKVNIGISIGYSVQNGTKTVDEMIYEADRMMYVDKNNNKFPD